MLRRISSSISSRTNSYFSAITPTVAKNSHQQQKTNQQTNQMAPRSGLGAGIMRELMTRMALAAGFELIRLMFRDLINLFSLSINIDLRSLERSLLVTSFLLTEYSIKEERSLMVL